MSPSLSSRFFPFAETHSPSLRLFAARVLRRVSWQLARLARQLVAVERRRAERLAPGVIEFYAESGAAEGALYVDGQLIGYLPGVTRL